jgi:hypothetical protein
MGLAIGTLRRSLGVGPAPAVMVQPKKD